MKHRDISLSDDEQGVCSTVGCGKTPKRSIPRKRVEKTGSLNLQGSSRKTALCTDCYRIFKKSSKKDRTMESLGR
ncbi:hypothetical protein OAO35_02935 [Euryarchaeota archaeon]|nr:hypothetical protein [Euryarchaeota archaeon]